MKNYEEIIKIIDGIMDKKTLMIIEILQYKFINNPIEIKYCERLQNMEIKYLAGLLRVYRRIYQKRNP